MIETPGSLRRRCLKLCTSCSYTFDASALAVFHYILPCHNRYEITIQHVMTWRQSLRSIVCVLIKSGEDIASNSRSGLILRSRVRPRKVLQHAQKGTRTTALETCVCILTSSLMCLPQWLLKALRQALRGHARGLSPLKAVVLLWCFFRRLFQRFSHPRDDGAPDEHTQHIGDRVLYLRQGVEPTKSAMLLAVDGDTDQPVTAVVCRSARPDNPRSSNNTALVSVASRSQTGLAFETDLNPPLHSSHPSSIMPTPIGSSVYSSAHSNPSQLSSSMVYNSTADTHLNSSDVHLPHARPSSGQGGLSSDSEAIVVPPPPTAAQHDGQNQDGVPNSTLHDAYPYIRGCSTRDSWNIFSEEVGPCLC